MSSKVDKAIEVLSNWEEEFSCYDIFCIQDVGFESSGDMDFLSSWFENGATETMKQQFESFASTGDGGEYLLWNYEGLKDEAPIVFFGSDGNYNMVAANAEEFLCLLSSGKACDADSDERCKWEDNVCSYHLESIREDFELNSDEKAQTMLDEDIMKFRKIVASNFDYKEAKTCVENMNQHPSFRHWVESHS